LLLNCCRRPSCFVTALAERAKGRADLLKHAEEKEQQIVDLERELKEVREAAAADKKRLETSSLRRGARSWRPLHSLTLLLLVGFSLCPFLNRRWLAVS
jgi:hypothetical protein